jgi:hypothetical protein
MKKRNLVWSIRHELRRNYGLIEFAEYQREPTVWDLKSKRKLVDSILRRYDFANIYLYFRPEQNRYECIDGRQRLSAMLSFLGLNQAENDNPESRVDNQFVFKSSDELFGTKFLSEFDNKKFSAFTAAQQDQFLDYTFNVVEITEIEEEDDLNLMFLRLQLGAPLNGGEKLKAMKGFMRDVIFKRLGTHAYFQYLAIPSRRFSRELTAAQIAVNYFSMKEKGEYSRSRFIDLQDFFRKHSTPLLFDEQFVAELNEKLNHVYEVLLDFDLKIKNRAMGVTAFFSLNRLIDSGDKGKTKRFIGFLKKFIHRLNVEIKKGDAIPQEFRYLLKFQAYISQAPVEKIAIAGRDARQCAGLHEGKLFREF